MKKVFEYGVAGVAIFLIVLFVGLCLRLPFLEALRLAAGVAAAGVGALLWYREIWWKIFKRRM